MNNKISKLFTKVIAWALPMGMVMGGLTSCNDWLDVKPNNEQITVDYWQSKEDVEAVVMTGYKYMRDVVPTFIKWGELRGGTLYSTGSDSKIQDFNVTPSHSLCVYSDVYKVINAANSVIKYAPTVVDDTYYPSMMNSHLCEAYFQRAYCNFILLKNFRDVPLLTEPYVDDTEEFDLAKSTEAEIIAQIKADVKAALATGAAKGSYDDVTDANGWQTKGRVTKWALYALMADVCLWNEDYQECSEYCDMILNATDTYRPVFLAKTENWYDMFYPGNSNESIFELNWNYTIAQETNNFNDLLYRTGSFATLRFTDAAMQRVSDEVTHVSENLAAQGQSLDGRLGRMLLASVIQSGTAFYIWKYAGNDIADTDGGARVRQDANFIIYRVAEVMLMKAQAHIMMGGQQNYKTAVQLINRIRQRALIGNFNDIDTEGDDADIKISQLTEQELLEEVLNQKEMEFIGEGKRWYDILWLGRIQNHKYRQLFVDKILEGNQTTNSAWIESVLINDDAWYLPLPQKDIDSNRLLEQNPYYATTK